LEVIACFWRSPSTIFIKFSLGKVGEFLLLFACDKTAAMIEVEIYAMGIRALGKILELDHALETVPHLRYKVDSNHDIVYFDFTEPTLTIDEIHAIFRNLGLNPRIVGSVPQEIAARKQTQRIQIDGH
jgi:hypothetical protein